MEIIYVVLCYEAPIGIFYGNESGAFMLAKTQGEAANEHGEYDPITVHRVTQQGEVNMTRGSAYMTWEEGEMVTNPFKKG